MPVSVTVPQQASQPEPSFRQQLWSAVRVYALAVFGSMFLAALYLEITSGTESAPVLSHLLATFTISAFSLTSLLKDRPVRDARDADQHDDTHNTY